MIRHPKIDGYAISSKKAPDYIKKGFKSWTDQRQRCYNPKDPRYKWYGEKGIRVEYSAYELVSWYIGEYKKRKFWKRPQVSRKDHEKNYSLDNIELLECSENSKERILRCGTGTKPHKIISINLKTNEKKLFKSIRQAERELNVSKSGIQHQLYGKLKRKPLNGLFFAYQENWED